MRPAALARLLRAELRGRRLGAMLMFVAVIVLASAAFVAGLAGQTKASERWDAAFAEANGAHVTIDGRELDTLAAVAGRPDVAAASAPYRRTSQELDILRDGRAVTTVYVREMAGADLPAIATPLLRDGRWAGPGTDDEIVIDRAFGLEEGIDVGDAISLSTPTGSRSFTVVGRAVDFVDCFYPNCTPVTTWLEPAGFATLGVATVNTVFLRLNDPDSDEKFVAELGGYGIGTQGWTDTRNDTLAIYEIFGSFLSAFGVFVMIAAAIVVAGSMATRVVARRRDIGLLKAMGTTPRQVTASIVLAHVCGAAVAVVVGWLVGGLLSPLTEVDLGRTLGTGGASFSPANLLTALIMVELIVVVATVVPAWRAGRLATTAALAPIAAHPARGRSLGRVAPRLGLGPVGVAGLRDAFGRPARSVLTALALALAIVAVLTTIGTERTFDRLFAESTLVGDPEELRVYPTGEDAAIAQVIAREDGITSWFTETEQELALGDEPFLGFAMGRDVSASGFDVREGRMFVRSGEAVAGWGLLDRFGLSVGDEVTVEANGHPMQLTIVGWYREGEDTGEVLRFPLVDLQRVKPDAQPQWASVNVGEGVTPESVAASLASKLRGAARVQLRPELQANEIDAFRMAFSGVSLLVVIVALANLASTMLLAARERAHDLGVLRAVGVTPSQLLGMIAAGAVALAILAALIGIPLGWAVSSAVTEVAGAASGIGPGIGVGPGVGMSMLVVSLSIVVAALLGAIAALRPARAEVADLVRYE